MGWAPGANAVDAACGLAVSLGLPPEDGGGCGDCGCGEGDVGGSEQAPRTMAAALPNICSSHRRRDTLAEDADMERLDANGVRRWS
jgi:hypothetical protein